MGKKRKLLALSFVFLTIHVAATGCNNSAVSKNTNKTDGADSEVSAEAVSANAELEIRPEYSDEELSSEYDKSSAVSITLADDKTECNSNKVSVDGNVITILKSGTYILKGELSDGRIIVDIDDDDIVRLVLAGVTITSGDSAPIFVKEAKETIITLEENTTNTITDAETYVLEDTEKNEPNAAIFSKDDLAVNGTGTLVVHANYNHGIQSKDDLVIISGTLNITSVGDGIVGKDSVLVKEADITMESGNAGIKGTSTESGKGYVYLENPLIDITSVGDGLHSNTVVQMDGGDVTIKSEDDGIHADIKVLVNGGTLDITESYEGIEGCIIIINDGNIAINSSDDGLNASNGSGSEMAGAMVGGMKDRMQDREPGNLSENGQERGTDTVPEDMPEGMQGEKPEGVPEDLPERMQGEKPEEIPSGMENAAKDRMKDGAGDNQNVDNQNQEDTTAETSAILTLDVKIEINGGEIYVNAEGDGIDSNGYVVMNGGTVYVDGPQNGGNGALDYESSFVVNGGVLVAVGSSQMAMAPSDSSEVNSVHLALENYYDGGTEIVIRDLEGNEIISYTPAKKFNSIVFTSEKLITGESYVLYSDGEEIETITVSDVVTTSGNVSQGMGGHMGGGKPGEMFGGENGDMGSQKNRTWQEQEQ